MIQEFNDDFLEELKDTSFDPIEEPRRSCRKRWSESPANNRALTLSSVSRSTNDYNEMVICDLDHDTWTLPTEADLAN